MTKTAFALRFGFGLALAFGALGCDSSKDDKPDGPDASSSAVAVCPPATPNDRGVGGKCTNDSQCTMGTKCNVMAPEPYCAHSQGPGAGSTCSALTCGKNTRCCTFETPIGPVATCIPNACTPPDNSTCN